MLACAIYSLKVIAPLATDLNAKDNHSNCLGLKVKFLVCVCVFFLMGTPSSSSQELSVIV